MFDAVYFRDRFPQDVREKRRAAARGHEPCVKIHLHGGATYTVARTVDLGPGWVVFDAYAKKKHRTAKEEMVERVTFAYNAISLDRARSRWGQARALDGDDIQAIEQGGRKRTARHSGEQWFRARGDHRAIRAGLGHGDGHRRHCGGQQCHSRQTLREQRGTATLSPCSWNSRSPSQPSQRRSR